MSIASCRQSCDGLADERMVGNLAIADDVVGARGLVGKHRRHEVVGAHALQRRRDLLAAAEARQRKRDARRSTASARRTSALRASPAPARRAPSSSAGSARRRRDRSCGCVDSDSTIASSVAAACSSKLNLRQKRLRSARPHARLMRLPNGEWMTSCMPPLSSKKRSSTIGRLRRQRAERGLARSSGNRRAAPRPRARRPLAARCSIAARAFADVLAQARHRVRQLVGAPRRFAEPERNRRRLALRILDAHAARFDAPDRYDVLPSWKTSPARLSTAKSSLTVPTFWPAGSSTTS